MTIAEIRAEINKLDAQIEEWQQQAFQMRPAFIYDAENEMSELDSKIEAATGQKEMLLDMLEGGVTDG